MAPSGGVGISDVRGSTAAILIALLMCVAGGESSARAQRTSGFFANPIGLIELTDLLESNGVAYRDVYARVEAAHVTYLAACDELRTDKIEAVQKRTREMHAGGAWSLSVPDLQKMSDGCRDVIAQNLELEKALFDAVRDALPEHSHLGVERARATRERTQIQSFAGLEWGQVERVPDVAAIMRSLAWKDLSDAATVRAECELALDDYDLRQIKLFRTTLSKALAVPVDFAKVLSSGVLDDMLSKDPDDRAQATPPNPALVKVFAAVIEANSAARASTKRAFRSVHSVMTLRSAPLARAFRKAFIAQMYPEISQVPTDDFETQATNALRLKRLSGDQRATIRAICQQWQTQDDRLIDAHIDLQERLLAWMDANLGAFDAAFHHQLISDQEVLEEKQSKGAETALRAISSIAGVEIQTLLDKLGTHEESDLFLPSDQVNLTEAVAGPLDTAGVDEAVVKVSAIAGEAIWFDKRMDDAWMDRIGESIQAEPGPRATLESLKADYWRAWDARIAPMAEAMSRPFGTDVPDDTATLRAVNVLLGEADIAKWVVDARTTQREMRELEDQFFADVQSAVAQPNQSAVIEMLRIGRACGERVDALDTIFDGIDGGEENANVILAATGVQLSAADCAKVALVLEPKLAELQAASDRLRAAVIDSWRVGRVRTHGYSTFGKGKDNSRWGEVWRAMKTQDEAMRAEGLAASKAKAALQREAFDAVIEVLSDSARKAVRGAYLRDAYFRAAGANDGASEVLARACALADLTEAQRGSLSIARSEYVDERDGAVALMIEKMRTAPPTQANEATKVGGAEEAASGGAVRVWIDQRTQLEQIERYSFARDAARDKMLSRLKNTLNEEQLRRVGIK